MELVLERQALAKLGPLPEGGPLGRVTRGGDADAQIRSLTAINRARLTEEPVGDLFDAKYRHRLGELVHSLLVFTSLVICLTRIA